MQTTARSPLPQQHSAMFLADPIARAWVSYCMDEVDRAPNLEGDDNLLQLGRLDLMPGDTLYAQGTWSSYIYIVESGLMQCLAQQDDGLALPGNVCFVGSGGLLGHYDQSSRRQESAQAVTRTRLLGMPLTDLLRMEDQAPVLAELITRRLSQSLMDGWRTAYRLRDLPPSSRTLAGLGHLARQNTPRGEVHPLASTMPMQLDMAVLAHWLCLPPAELHTYLSQLESAQVLTLKGGRITSLKPQAILNATKHINEVKRWEEGTFSEYSQFESAKSD
jgi:CRP-like cAMP-binding protein